MAPPQSSLERGLPISLSRWTDVAHWYMPWLQNMLTVKGVLAASDPTTLTLRFWKADPDSIHSLFFWTKYPPKLTSALQTWLAGYRVFTAVTITGWSEVETRVPPLEDQLQALENHIALVGTELVQWRYSPVPADFAYSEARQEQFAGICKRVASLGLTTVDVALLQPSVHWKQGYAVAGDEENEQTYRNMVLSRLRDLAGANGIQVGVCADDLKVMQRLENAAGLFETKCLDREKLDKVFGMTTETHFENGCGCQMSLDPCNGKQFGCASGCKYCYVPFTNTGK